MSRTAKRKQFLANAMNVVATALMAMLCVSYCSASGSCVEKLKVSGSNRLPYTVCTVESASPPPPPKKRHPPPPPHKSCDEVVSAGTTLCKINGKSFGCNVNFGGGGLYADFLDETRSGYYGFATGLPCVECSSFYCCQEDAPASVSLFCYNRLDEIIGKKAPTCPNGGALTRCDSIYSGIDVCGTNEFKNPQILLCKGRHCQTKFGCCATNETLIECTARLNACSQVPNNLGIVNSEGPVLVSACGENINV